METEETIPAPPRPVPLCLHCLEPYDPLAHYCPRCGHAVGQFTPYIPFVNIGYWCEFWGRLWANLWSPRRGHYFMRVMAAVLILFFVPILFAGIPFVILERLSRRRGFDAIPNGGKPSRFLSESGPAQDAALPDYPDDVEGDDESAATDE